MAINERLIHTAADAAGGGTGNQEEGLILHLDANDVDSYDGDGTVWYDIKDHEYTPATNADEHFNTVTYTGASAPHVINTVGFQPDLIWIKNRDTTDSYAIVDSVRGITSPTPYLASDQTAAEATSTNMPTSVQSDGFTITGNGGRTNTIGEDYVAWCFKAGGAAVLNEEGSIDSQVSANNDLGFSIATYTGVGYPASSTAEIGHGLDTAPELVIIKGTGGTGQSGGAGSWVVGSSLLGAGWDGSLYLNSQNEYYSAINYFWNGKATSNVIKLKNDWFVNGSNNQYVAYCFTSKRGVSKVGSYTGNGSTTGPIVYLGFEPAFLMFKCSSQAGNWIVIDNKRATSNPRTPHLRANSNSADDFGTNEYVDFLGNGFQPKGVSNYNNNSSGQTYIYYAVAKNTKETSLIPDTDLELHLDAGDDTTVSVSTWTDLTTNSYDGTFTNFSSTLIDFYEKELGNFITFDGTNDYVKINNTGLTKNSGTDFAVEVWARMHTTGTADYMVSQTTDDGNTQNWLLRFHSDNKIKFFVYGTDEYLSTSSTYSANVWYHIVGLVESNGIVRIYVNGELEVSSSSGKSADTVARNTFIGSLGNQQTTDADIGQVRIYHTALTQDQIRQNYNFTKNNYPNGNNGTISGASWNPGGYFDFNGNNDEVTFSSNSMPSTGFSISAWFNMNTLPSSGYAYGVVSWGDEAAGKRRSILVWDGGAGNPKAYFSGYAANIAGATDLSAGTWYHVIVTEENGTAKVYLNGDEDGSGSVTLNAFTGTTVRIGNTGSSSENFNGNISDVKIFDKVLTPAEVTAEHAKGYNGAN